PPPAQPFNLPGDGTPPNFDQLLAAIQTVLAADPGGVVDLTAVTADQCKHIAREIINGSQAPLPTEPERPEDMYTNPPNSGKFSDPTNRTANNSKANALATFARSMPWPHG